MTNRIANLTDEECHRMQQAAEKRLQGCWLELDNEGAEEVSAAPFCGCEVCVVRETLDAAISELVNILNA